MGLFGSIMNKIFHHGAAPASGAASGGGGPAPQAAAPGQAPAPAASAPAQPVDVEQVLESMAAQHGGGGNWRVSIVDLLKLLDLDSSLPARHGLAEELNVHAGADGTAEENTALIKAVWAKLAENGGRVPDSLKH